LQEKWQQPLSSKGQKCIHTTTTTTTNIYADDLQIDEHYIFFPYSDRMNEIRMKWFAEMIRTLFQIWPIELNCDFMIGENGVSK